MPNPRQRPLPIRAPAVVAVSLLLHGLIAFGPLLSRRIRALAAGDPIAAVEARTGLGDRAISLARRPRIAAARSELVERAREDLRAGRLRLGEFVLDANALDAREEGAAFDRDKARALYDKRVAALRDGGSPPRDAIAEIFGDLHYYGRTGGRMGDALIEGGGACEPLSHLLVSALHDAGHGEAAHLRHYGGEGPDGVMHLAPIYLEDETEYDLLSGGKAHTGGVRIAAVELVEVYARAHGLAPPVPAVAAQGSGDDKASAAPPAAPARSTLASGYPPNQDRYPGSIPLYQSRAVHEPSDDAAPASAFLEAREQATDCAFFVRMAALDPPTLAVEGASRFTVEIHRAPIDSQIDRTFSLIRAVEQTALAPSADRADRIMGLACLAALYDRAALDLALSRSSDLAKVAAEKHRSRAEEGARLLAEIDWSSREGADLERRLTSRFSGRSWVLLFLRGGDAAALRIASGGGQKHWGRLDTLAALVVAPSTRAQAIAVAAALPRGEQIDVMHEVFHVHDHQPPWASNYALDAGPGAAATEFARVYPVFRALEWGLWEGRRPAEEVLSRAVTDARREGLGRAWEELLVDYYCRQALNLYQHRKDGPADARVLKRWVEAHGFTDSEIYRSRLAELAEAI